MRHRFRPKITLQPALRSTKDDPDGWLDFLFHVRRVFEATGEEPAIVSALVCLLIEETRPDYTPGEMVLFYWAFCAGGLSFSEYYASCSGRTSVSEYVATLKASLPKLIRLGVLVRTRHTEGKPTYHTRLPWSLQTVKWTHPPDDEDEI